MTEEDGQQAGASEGTAGANRANGEASAVSSVFHLVMGLGRIMLPGAAWSLAGVGSKQSICELLGLDPAAIKTAC